MMRIKDGITFGEFNSMNEGLLLTYRDDTPPEEKVIKESLPFVQGDYDFSRILGEAIRENRTTTYEFLIKEYDYEVRKTLEVKYENMLLNQGVGRIYDTINPGYYFYGKCINAEVVLEEKWQQLKLIVTFDCYPYMISELKEGHDIWDEFNFELDVAQEVKHTINNTKEITLYNVGTPSVVPSIIASSEMTIEKGAVSVTVPPGTSKSELLRLNAGENKLKVTGNGTIEFDFFKELI